jgi:hypothetical protein
MLARNSEDRMPDQARLIELFRWSKLLCGLVGFARWQRPTPQGRRFERKAG